MRLLAQRRLASHTLVGVTEELAAARRAFDAAADRYACATARSPVLAAMRALTRRALACRLRPGSRVLEIGCGPGLDAVALARAGYRVTAIDWSPKMVALARERIAAALCAHRATARLLGLHQLDALPPEGFEAVFSNLGAFNCAPDLETVAASVAGRLRPGGLVVASVMGRLCPWDWVLSLARGRWRRAFVRLHRPPVAVPFHGHTVWTRYYTPAAFVRAFARAGFVLDALRSLALFTPPPYLDGWARRHPRLVATLLALDTRLAARPILRQFGDHFLVVLRRP